MYLCIASTRKVATAASAIPPIATDPFGILKLKNENPASTSNNRPSPDKIVIISFHLIILIDCIYKKGFSYR